MRTYTEEEVKQSCLQYFDGDDLATDVWMSKYAIKNKKGEYCELTPNDMHERLAKEFSKVENKYLENANGDEHKSEYGKTRPHLSYEKILSYFQKFKYIIPQGSVMSTLGNPYTIASLSNCIVLPKVHDSYAGICYADQQIAQLSKRRCGVGLDISTLRPAKSPVNNTAVTSTGAVSFMERFSSTLREVAQSGRRGAGMISMDINHPDIDQFVKIKKNLKKVTGANISIRLSDEFMSAVENDEEYVHKFPINSKKPEITKTSSAKNLWEDIIETAHASAEPGLLFWDRQHWYSTSSVYPQYENITTNPCGEISMNNDSCRLMVLNLFSFVKEPFTKKAGFDYELFYKTTYEAQRLMDDLVDLELEHVDKILEKIKSDPEPDYIKNIEIETWESLRDIGKKTRRTGLGFTAFADMLAALDIKFDSIKALNVIEKVMHTKCEAEFDSSIDMSIERMCFEGFDPSIEKKSHFVQTLKEEMPDIYKRMMTHGRRNISISTVAPTGSLSILTQSSSGVEPVFKLSFTRRKKINPEDKDIEPDFVDDMGDGWQEFEVYHNKLKMWMDVTGEKDETKSPYYGSTAEDIDWIKRVKIQAAVQKYITHSISSTINLPEDVSVEKVSEIYLKSWKMGLKGITVYRAGSRTGVLIDKKQSAEMKAEKYFHDHLAPKRPKFLDAEVHKFMNKGEKWVAFVGMYDGRPYEIFTGLEESFKVPNSITKGVIRRSKVEGHSQYDFIMNYKTEDVRIIEGLSAAFNPEFWNYSKLTSSVLRHGMPLVYVVDLISNLKLDVEQLSSWKNGVARTLKKYIPNGTKNKDANCANCGDEDGLVFEEGCLKCKSCGFSKCS